MILYSFLCAFLLSVTAWGQVMDHTASFRMVNADSYIRLHYDNDLLAGTDQYYTQGIHLEWVCPALAGNPLNRLLMVSGKNAPRFGIALEHNGYTPTSIRSNQILYGDRPFAGVIMLKVLGASSHSAQRYRLTSSLSLGMIGPVAGAEQIQRMIHRWTNGIDPQGWQYQIKNDLILNYEAGLEKNVFRSRYFLLNGVATGRVGTLSTRLSAGATLMLGKLPSAVVAAFGERNIAGRKQRWAVHLYAQPVVHWVGYDATLQGGLLFNRDSPYTLAGQAIERLVFEGRAGVVFAVGSFYGEYSQSVISREFVTGEAHGWGGVMVGVLF